MIPMVPVHRPAHPGYEVVFSGTLERACIRAQQRQPPPSNDRRHAKDRILRALRTKPAGRMWTLSQIASATGYSNAHVTSVVASLRKARVVSCEMVTFAGGSAGAQWRIWLAA